MAIIVTFEIFNWAKKPSRVAPRRLPIEHEFFSSDSRGFAGAGDYNSTRIKEFAGLTALQKFLIVERVEDPRIP